ncbi:Gp49 family protein [Burkholderia aenigmatica]|nr:Gp49 family protein [Burkholderia aenigmatica]MDN7881264.1 Gp49 family protein [Burkholderia aenigmatica]
MASKARWQRCSFTRSTTRSTRQPASTGRRNPLGLLTFCVIVLRNGFSVTGQSACVSPENFDAEIGRKVARQKAVDQIWALEGYLLKQKQHDAR